MLGELNERIPFPCRLLAHAPAIALDYEVALHLEVVLHPARAVRSSVPRAMANDERAAR